MKIIKTVRPDGSIRLQTVYERPSRCNPDYKDEVDVNNIMNRFLKTGQLTHINQIPMIATEDQVISSLDLQESIHQVREAEAMYNSLNKKLKKQFKNPQELLQFLDDPKNWDEAREIGLLPKIKNDDDDKTTTTIKNTQTPPSSTPPPSTPPSDQPKT